MIYNKNLSLLSMLNLEETMHMDQCAVVLMEQQMG